jgi:hypothetical protein
MSQQDKNEKDYLKELAPNLFSKEMDAGHEVPEGYFESIENQVLSKIEANRKDWLIDQFQKSFYRCWFGALDGFDSFIERH